MRDKVKRRIKATFIIGTIIFVITFGLILVHLSGYEQELKVEKDAYVVENDPDNNYGAKNYLRVGNYNLSKVYAFYYFNISSLPDKWTEARIVVDFDFALDSVDVGANLTYESWNEMTLTWNNKPTESVYRGHILCDGFEFGIPLSTDQIIDDGISVFLYGRRGNQDGYIQGYSKEGAASSNDGAWIEVHYEGLNPLYFEGLWIFGIIIFSGIVVVAISMTHFRKVAKQKKKKPAALGENWMNINLDRYYKDSTPRLKKEINQYITLRLEQGRTFIYINGKRFIQCIRLILNIPKEDVPLYDEVESIDEAAKLYNKHIYQNRIVTGPMAAPVRDLTHNITPEEEFWGHCSNIQAWVEHDYDTRILMSNISFPLLRELTRAGDPKARKVYKEEIALRLESGYPSVVQYLLAQGYIAEFTPAEFRAILESTGLIVKLSSMPNVLLQFLRSSAYKFPTLIEGILLQILSLPDGKNNFLSIIQRDPIVPFIPKLFQNRILHTHQFLFILKNALENLINRVDEKVEDIIDCIQVINKRLEGQNPNVSGTDAVKSIRNMFLNNKLLDELDEKEKLLFKQNIIERFQRIQSRCSYCGKVIPKGQDICEWCGHKKDDDEGGFYPYPFIFKPPGGGGGTMKGVAVIPVNVKA